MNATEAYARLQQLGVPVVATIDAAQVLGQSVDAANKTLKRLAGASLVTPVVRGVWALSRTVDPLLLPEYLTAPLPSYVSLQTALHQHGMIEQIPAVMYVVSLSRTRRVRTRFGTFSIHRVAPEFFGGFEMLESGVKMATPEKAFLDVLYLSATRNRLFARLPEIEIPRRFDRKVAEKWMAAITSRQLARIVRRRYVATIGTRGSSGHGREHRSGRLVSKRRA